MAVKVRFDQHGTAQITILPGEEVDFGCFKVENLHQKPIMVVVYLPTHHPILLSPQFKPLIQLQQP